MYRNADKTRRMAIRMKSGASPPCCHIRVVSSVWNAPMVENEEVAENFGVQTFPTGCYIEVVGCVRNAVMVQEENVPEKFSL